MVSLIDKIKQVSLTILRLSFRQRLRPRGGSTELWRPLQALNLLPPSRGLRNLLLLSDGHIQNAAMTLQLIRDGVGHSRLFTCGLRWEGLRRQPSPLRVAAF